MDMVTLVQQQQQTLDGNHEVQEEQDHVNGAVVSSQSHAVDCRSRCKFRGEAGRSARETAVVAPSNGSFTSFGDYSSTQCSDNDDDGEERDVQEGGGRITNLPVSSTIVQQHQAFATTNGDIALPNAEPSIFGNISVANSTEVRVGNETIYNGPVTINQFVYTNPAPNQDASNLDVSRASDDISDLSASKDNGAPNRSTFPQNTDLNKVMQWLWTWKRAALSCAFALILLAVVVSITVYFTHHLDAPVFPEIPDEGNTSVRFVERDEWDAQPPSEPLRKMKLPVPYVIICHTVTNFCTTQSECATVVRDIQDYHMATKHYLDVTYNFLVGGDGLAYIGRSWDYVGAHSKGYNSKSIGISFIGEFTSTLPPITQLHAAQKIIELGVKTGKIAPDYKLLGHRQVWKTLSPGDALYNKIKKWPHWSPQP